MRKTKIVCTIGPSCDNIDTITKMCRAGMNVARLNFSHGTHEDHRAYIEKLKEVRRTLGVPLAIMLDTKGPEYRIGTFKNGPITLAGGDTFTFTTDEIEGDSTRVGVNYKSLNRELSVGDRILLNNGLLSFTVTAIEGNDIHTVVGEGGVLSDRKSMSFPDKVLKQTYLSERDKSDLLFGIQNDVEYIACSFVSRKQDLLDVAAFLKEHGAVGIELIAKIENRSGVEHIEEICEACDGIMIARGDMGVEVPYEELPAIQKALITKSRLLGKRVITATEMLESMIHSPRPTRAEISDVANAVYDGTSAIMLSGETAAGKYPVEAVRAMARIAEHAEEDTHYDQRFGNTDFRIRNTVDAISHSVCGMAIDIGAKVIAVCSLSGSTIRMVSRFRPSVDILGMTIKEKTFHKLALSWGVYPVLSETYDSTDVLFYHAKQRAKELFSLQKGDRLIVTGGMTNGTSGNTNLLKIETI